jgi:DNA-binding transcriptional LysR family regulator
MDNIGVSRPLRTNDTTLSLQLTLTGSGLAYLPHWIIADDLKTGRLELAIDNNASFVIDPQHQARHTNCYLITF